MSFASLPPLFGCACPFLPSPSFPFPLIPSLLLPVPFFLSVPFPSLPCTSLLSLPFPTLPFASRLFLSLSSVSFPSRPGHSAPLRVAFSSVFPFLLSFLSPALSFLNCCFLSSLTWPPFLFPCVPVLYLRVPFRLLPFLSAQCYSTPLHSLPFRSLLPTRILKSVCPCPSLPSL